MRTLRKALTPFLVLVGFSLCVGSLDLSAQKKSTKKSTNKSKSTTKASPAQQKPTESQTIVSLDAKPEPLEATAFSFPKYEEFTLANGLHVYVIENHEQPLITASIIFKGGEAADPLGKEGVAAIAGDMLSKGAGGRSAKEIARTLDGVGASISASAGAETFSVSASGLKKHASLFVSVLSDMLLKPTFPGEELDKLRQQYVANIASQKSRPSELGQALARKVIYGINSPLARRKTEKSIASITRDDLIAFHKAYVNPNNASIAIVGDVTAKEVRQLLSAHLERWEKSTVPKLEIPPIETAPAGVYFIPRKGAVQSMVIVTAAAPAQRDADYESVDLMTGFLASGFGSRLFATLRETYSYTYSPFGFVTQGKHYNRIAVGAEVRTSVTDSALTVIQREIALLGANGPDPDDLERRKAFEIGQYRLAFEQASTVASLLQYAWANERPLDDVLTQTEKIEALTAADVQRAARTYFNMFAQRVVVVGDPSIRERLEAFGPVKEFTMDIEPAAAAAYEPVQQTVADIIALYERAVGGRQAVDAVTSTTYSGTIDMQIQGQNLKGSFVRKQMSPNKDFTEISLPIMKQRQWVNGMTSWTSLNDGQATEASADETQQLLLDARLFLPLGWSSAGYTTSVLGKRNGTIDISATAPTGRNEVYSFDATTGLLVRWERQEDVNGEKITIIERYADFTVVGGVQMPSTIRVDSPVYSYTIKGRVSLNDVDATVFTPAR